MTLSRKRLSWRTICVLLVATLFWTGCDDGLQSVDVDAPAETEAPNVRFSVSYDQTSHTFSTQWPDGMAASAKSGAAGEYLTHYESIRETVGFDAEGYVVREYEYLEGNADTRLPQEIRDDFGHLMPAPDAEADPVVRFEMRGGTMTYYGASGNVVHESPYDAEAFRLSADDLAALSATASGDVDARVSQNIAQLKEQGVAFSLKDDVAAVIEDAEPGIDGIAKVKEVVDLRIGRPAQTIYFREDGSYDSIELRTHEIVNDVPVMTGSVTYDFGEVNGEWTVAQRTEVVRSNVKVSLQ